MATVRLNFIPPDDPNIAALHIYECPTADGTFTEIDRVTEIGSYPTYIDTFSTANATNASNWFEIAWEDINGQIGDPTLPVKGGTTTLVGEIVDRVLLRDSSLDDNVVAQEAEAVVQEVTGAVEPDTLVKSDVTAMQLSGMVLLTMARAAIFDMLRTQSTSGVDYTVGLVSVKQSSAVTSQRSLKLIQDIITQANKELGRNYSVVMLMEEIEVAGFTSSEIVAVDLSRTIVEFD